MKRKRYIIEGNFQIRFILRFVLIIVGVTLLSTGAILGLFYFKYQYSGADISNFIFRIAPEGTTDVSSLFQIIFTPLLAANLLVLLISIPFSLLYSHKIAGPVYRLEQSLDLLISGEMDFMINLRKNDEFKYLADKMNALIDYMRRNVGEVRLSYRVIYKRLLEIMKITDKDTIDIKSLKKEIMELDRFFKERREPFSY